MKRSNRLVLLVGFLLAIVAFVGIVYVLNQEQASGPDAVVPPTELPTVYAVTDIPLGTTVTLEMVEQRLTKVEERGLSPFNSVSLVVGKVVRTDVAATAQLQASDFATGSGILNEIKTPPGLQAMAIQVDQISGVGTLINTGDYVDMIVGLTGDRFPVITIDAETNNITPVAGLNATSVKLLLQGMQVIGVLRPPVDQAATPPGTEPGTALTGGQELVIVAATPQQAEVIKFAQLDGSITLTLRSAADFVRDPITKELIPPPIVPTTGITLAELVNGPWGVLPPELIETVLPATQRPRPSPTPTP